MEWVKGQSADVIPGIQSMPNKVSPPKNRAERRQAAKRLKRNGVDGATIRARRNQVAKGILEHQKHQIPEQGTETNGNVPSVEEETPSGGA